MKHRIFVFIDELRRLTGVSYEYADAAWFSCRNFETDPKVLARRYAARYFPNKEDKQ